MIRVLHIIQQHGPGRGGVRTFVSTMLDCDASDIEQSVLSVGRVEGDKFGSRFYGPLVDEYSPLVVGTLGVRQLRSFLTEHRFDVVQIHTNNGIGFVFAHAAESAGVPVRIVHCHNSALGSSSRLKGWANKALIKKYIESATARWACSEVAGDYLFMGGDFTVVHNGVDADKFRFSIVNREDVRQSFGISGDAIVAGLVGAGIPAKNTLRALEIFSRVHADKTNARFLLIGQGEELSLAKEKAKELGLSGSAIFVGTVDDIWKYYSAMDVLLAPSLYEGLPIAFVEAQANGLPILSSDAVSPEADLTGLVQRIELAVSDQDWAKMLEVNARKRESTSLVDFASVLDQVGYTTRSLHQLLSGSYREMTKGI